jgi:hypothetical protein
MFGSDKKKISLKPTPFLATIAGQDYRFAALSLKEWEQQVEAEAAAVKANDRVKLLDLHRQVVLVALTKGGNDVSMDELVEMDVPLFQAIFSAVMQAHGMKLEAKVGEASPL